MSYIKNTFVNLKDLIIGSVSIIVTIIRQLSIANLRKLYNVEYKGIKEKLKDLKQTNWDLAQYHLVAGNYNDAIMRFKILQNRNYKAMECKYFLGRIYLEKNNSVKAKRYLDQYLATEDNNYRAEAKYCISVINHSDISSIPYRIICNKRDRIALNLERTDIDTSLVNRYQEIIQILRLYMKANVKIFEIGCYIGVLGRIIKETFAGNIQYYFASEIGYEAAGIAREMYLNKKHVYDEIYLFNTISQLLINGDDYSIVLIPDILAYYPDLSHIFISTSSALKTDGIGIIVVRVIKRDLMNEKIKDIEFLHPIEEFRYSYDYVVASAMSSGLQLQNSSDIGDGFELFVFKKI